MSNEYTSCLSEILIFFIEFLFDSNKNNYRQVRRFLYRGEINRFNLNCFSLNCFSLNRCSLNRCSLIRRSLNRRSQPSLLCSDQEEINSDDTDYKKQTTTSSNRKAKKLSSAMYYNHTNVQYKNLLTELSDLHKRQSWRNKSYFQFIYFFKDIWYWWKTQTIQHTNLWYLTFCDRFSTRCAQIFFIKILRMSARKTLYYFWLRIGKDTNTVFKPQTSTTLANHWRSFFYIIKIRWNFFIFGFLPFWISSRYFVYLASQFNFLKI